MTCAFRMKKKIGKVFPQLFILMERLGFSLLRKKIMKVFINCLKEFKKITGFGIILNTSFNKHGRTICETPNDAIDDFLDTNMDYLLIEGFLVRKSIV